MISAPITPFVTPTLVIVQSALDAEVQFQATRMDWILIVLGIVLASRLFVNIVRGFRQ